MSDFSALLADIPEFLRVEAMNEALEDALRIAEDRADARLLLGDEALRPWFATGAGAEVVAESLGVPAKLVQIRMRDLEERRDRERRRRRI